MLESFLNPSRGYDQAGKELQKGWGEAKGFEMPFLNNGLDQTNRLNSAENNLLNPGAMQNQWAKGYEMSPYAQQLQQQAKSAGLDAASSQGLLGSSASINNIQQGASNIMQKDRQQYMNDLMQKYMAGIGIGQNMYGTGANMGGMMGGQALDVGSGMGSMAFGANKASGDQFKDLLNMAMKGAMAAFGPGGSGAAAAMGG